MPTSPSTPVEPCRLDSRHSHCGLDSPVAPGLADQPALPVATPRHGATSPISPASTMLPRLLQRRRIAVGQVDHVDEAGRFGGLGHRQRVGMVRRQRLFAEHVLAGGQQRQRRRLVDAVRRDVDGRVELAPGDRRLEALETPRDLVCRRRMLPRGPAPGRRRRRCSHPDIAANSVDVMPGDAAGTEEKQLACISSGPRRHRHAGAGPSATIFSLALSDRHVRRIGDAPTRRAPDCAPSARRCAAPAARPAL